MTSSTESVDDVLPSPTRPAWSLTLAHHSDLALLGRRIALGGSSEAVLGREVELLGEGALADKGISREHARVIVDEADRILVEDLSSKNGTYVNGRRVGKVELKVGDVIGLGARLLVVGRGPAFYTPETSEPGAPLGLSPLVVAAREDARRLAVLSGPVILVGEHGVGKEVFARFIHARSKRDAFVVLHPGAFTDEEAPIALFGEVANDGGQPPTGLLAKADRGTLLLDDLELAGPKLQAALLRFLDTGELPDARRGGPPRLDVRVLVTTQVPLEELVKRGVLSSALAGRLGMSTLEVPPLRERIEDVPILFRAALAKEGHPESRVDPRLALAMLRHPWPDNVRELFAFARLALHLSEDRSRITLTPEHLEALGADPEVVSVSFASSPEIAFVARDGAWFTSEGARVDLAHRPNLSRVLAALAKHHVDGASDCLSVEDLFEAGWPGERVARSAAAARVYVAIATLRKLGLRRSLERSGGGYRISAQHPTRVVGDDDTAR